MIKDNRAIDPFGLRTPAKLKERLQKAANKNARSLNSEMVVRLEDSFRPPLSHYSDGELISELISRYDRGTIAIRIGATLDNNEQD